MHHGLFLLTLPQDRLAAYRHRGLAVTDLTASEWCEQQTAYKLSARIPKVSLGSGAWTSVAWCQTSGFEMQRCLPSSLRMEYIPHISAGQEAGGCGQEAGGSGILAVPGGPRGHKRQAPPI